MSEIWPKTLIFCPGSPKKSGGALIKEGAFIGEFMVYVLSYNIVMCYLVYVLELWTAHCCCSSVKLTQSPLTLNGHA